jgi:SAM-dependent methyltransferase
MRPGALLAPPRLITSLKDCFFYHTMELPGLGVVVGLWDLRGKFNEYTGGVEVKDKSVLDIGAASGFLTFEAERRGAIVLSFDMSSVEHQHLLPFKDKPYYQDHARWIEKANPFMETWKNAYWLSHRLLNSRAEVFYGNIYALPPALGMFDIAIVGSVLEHLSNPIGALASIARLTREVLIIVTPIIESDEPVARFEPTAANPDQDYTWWIYSTGIYREVLAMLGFTITSITTASYFYAYGNKLEQRTTIVATRNKAAESRSS